MGRWLQWGVGRTRGALLPSTPPVLPEKHTGVPQVSLGLQASRAKNDRPRIIKVRQFSSQNFLYLNPQTPLSYTIISVLSRSASLPEIVWSSSSGSTDSPSPQKAVEPGWFPPAAVLPQLRLPSAHKR